MGSSDSSSLLSEPPDIGKLFSSYIYESPELNSIDDFKDSGHPGLAEIGESKKEKEGDFGGGIQEKGHDYLLADWKATSDDLLECKSIAGVGNWTTEVPKDSDSLSLCSEPPDLKNWFSSYAYESPTISANYEIWSHPQDKLDEEVIGGLNRSTGKDGELTKVTKTIQENELEAQKIFGGLVKCNNSVGAKEYEHHYFPKDSLKADGNKNSAILNDFTPQRLSHHILHLKHMQDHDNGSAKDFELPILNGESPLDVLNTKFAADAGPVSLGIKSRSGSKDRNLPQKSIQSRVPTEETDKSKDFTGVTDTRRHSENLKAFNLVNRKTVNKEIGGVDNKENDWKCWAETGFISTRTGRQCDRGNRFTGMLESNSCYSGYAVKVSPRDNKEATATRKVLLETTNFQAPNVSEVTEKWRCPQKSKPNLGPPLKQLRLEQWVRRI